MSRQVRPYVCLFACPLSSATELFLTKFGGMAPHDSQIP